MLLAKSSASDRLLSDLELVMVDVGLVSAVASAILLTSRTCLRYQCTRIMHFHSKLCRLLIATLTSVIDALDRWEGI